MGDGSNSEKLLSTGDMARGAGTTLRTVRFYEEAGMLQASAMGNGGRRLYRAADLIKLALIMDLRELDLSIDDIRSLFALRAGAADAPDMAVRFRHLLKEQLERAQRRMNALRRVKGEFAAALQLLGECDSCEIPLERHACTACDVVSRDEAPRIMKIVLGDPHGGS